VRRTTLETGVAQVLRDLGTPSAGQSVVVALSGGADSVALLDALVTLSRSRRFSVVAAHLDHGLRAGSAEDATFCASLCATLGVPLHTAAADVRSRAREEGGGLELAARVVRYAFLRQVERSTGACAIALAHTRDDQAETVLLRLMRGSGRLGLSAMRPLSGDLLRPILGLGRQEVLDHLRRKGLSWREDPTNADLNIARNRVRHELLPYLERHFHPAIRQALARAASLLAEESNVLAGVSTDVAVRAQGRVEGGAYAISRTSLGTAPRAVARLSVRKALSETGGLQGVGLGHVDRILDLASRPDASGRRLALPGGREAIVHFDEVRIGPVPAPAAEFSLKLPVPGRVELPDGRSVVARRALRSARAGDTATVVEAPEGDLLVRTRRPGDRVRLAGREMSLKRYLMARRVPAALRSSLPLVAAGDCVLWVAGHDIDTRAGKARTARRLVRLELEDLPAGKVDALSAHPALPPLPMPGAGGHRQPPRLKAAALPPQPTRGSRP
jgi:tRNA(Ile)-lysidine synthase